MTDFLAHQFAESVAEQATMNRKRMAAMLDFEFVSYAVLGLSLSATAIRIASWILSANPRSIINVGRWLLIGLLAAAPPVLLWLMTTGRSTYAMIFAGVVLLVFVEGVSRWRGTFRPLRFMPGDFPTMAPDLSAGIVPSDRCAAPGMMRPEPLVQQSVAILRAYLEHAKQEGEQRLTELDLGNRPMNRFANGSGRGLMSAEEALDILGLTASARPDEIMEAHSRLAQKLNTEFGSTHYLTKKINDARDTLLGDHNPIGSRNPNGSDRPTSSGN
jgi:hypothetical protein